MRTLTVVLAILVALTWASWLLLPGLWTRIIISFARRRSGLVSRTIFVDGIRWHYLAGSAGPTLLLLHGFGADTSCWLRIARLLRPRFSLLIPDLPGFGESEPPEKLQFDIETQARRLEAFLDRLNVYECVAVGNSMGGYLATALAARNPRRVRAMWLLAPLGVRSVDPGAVLSSIDAGDTEQVEIESVRHFRTKILPTMYAGEPHLPSPLIRTMAKAAMARQAETPRMLREVRFANEPLETIATHIEVPVLIQWGEDDQVVNPAGLEVLERAFRSATGAITERCGHLPMLERPSESARLFLRFAGKHNLG